MEMNYAELLKVMSDPVRLEIIRLLLEGETCSCTMIDKLPISQPTLSYHLKTLVKVGVAHSKRDGNWIKYFVNRDVLSQLSVFIHQLSKTECFTCAL